MNTSVADTIVSSGNEITYDLSDTVTVSSWDQMQALFVAGTIEEYTYIRFTGPVYFHNYTGTDTVNHRVHMNPDATGADYIKCDGRSVCLREDVLVADLGADWSQAFGLADGIPSNKMPGYLWEGEFIALYTGANGTYFQLTILDADHVIPANS